MEATDAVVKQYEEHVCENNKLRRIISWKAPFTDDKKVLRECPDCGRKWVGLEKGAQPGTKWGVEERVLSAADLRRELVANGKIIIETTLALKEVPAALTPGDTRLWIVSVLEARLEDAKQRAIAIATTLSQLDSQK